VLNGTLRTGLAHQVASSLHRHAQLPIGKVGNAPRMVKGPSVVRYPERMAWEARLVASRLSPPATLAAQAGASTVELDLGTAFRRLATEQEATAEYRQLTAAATASPAPTPSAHSCSRS
jgi:hypothetical protein